MHPREKVAIKNKHIKIFMMPQEVVLILNCLNWVQSDIKSAIRICERNIDIVEGDMTKEMLDNFIPIIDWTIYTTMLHTDSHYQETKDTVGYTKYKAILSDMEKETTDLQARVRTIFQLASGNKNIDKN
jgi:hypothetical protein